MEKKNKNLNAKEFKKLFERYNIYTLDSINILLNVVGEVEQNALVIRTFNSAYNKVYNESKDGFEGRNEYTYSDMVRNFDLTEISDNFESLNNRELGFISKLVKDGVYKLKKDQQEASIEPKLLEFIKAFDKEFILRLKPTVDILSEKEIKVFFDKYSVVELDAFTTILDYAKDYNVRDIQRVRREVYKSKYDELTNNFEVGVKPSNFKYSDIEKVNKNLSGRELKFLHAIVDSAASYLYSIQELEYAYTEVFEEFDSGYYPIKEMGVLLDSIEKEIEKRKNKAKLNRKTI